MQKNIIVFTKGKISEKYILFQPNFQNQDMQQKIKNEILKSNNRIIDNFFMFSHCHYILLV